MNSDTSTRYGSRVLRHGRSRAARAHQARSLRVNACACAGLRTRGVDVRPWVPKIQPMSNGAALTLGPLRLVARWSLRTADHAGRFSFLIADMFRGLAEWRIWE